MLNPKGTPFTADTAPGWGLFDGGVPFPVAVITQPELDHNRATMRAYCEANGVDLAPHGKTTMTPGLFRRQIEDGAWAITAATVWQAAMMRAHGVERVLIANEVVVPAEIEWLGRALDEGFEVLCYVDSLDGVEIIEETLTAAGVTTPLPVLLEVGATGFRAGVRSDDAAMAVAEAAHRAERMVLAGVSSFEGVLPADRVGDFLAGMVGTVEAISAAGYFDTPEVIASAGGSAFFDQVVEHLGAIELDRPVRVVIRSGCYITHDDGGYEKSSPMGASQRVEGRLRAALEVWGAVISRPEPGRVIVGLGKRDISPEATQPLAKKVVRRGTSTVEPLEPRRVTQMNDQHAYLDIDPSDPLAVGDLVAFGISHPCTTFDKWRSIQLVDENYRVIESMETVF